MTALPDSEAPYRNQLIAQGELFTDYAGWRLRAATRITWG